MRILLATVLLFALTTPALAQGKDSITIKAMPKTNEEFVKLRDSTATTPEGGAAMFVLAMMAWEKDKDVGEPFFTIALDKGQLKKGKGGYKGYAPGNSAMFLIKRIDGKKVFSKSYLDGTSPKKGYAAKAPFKFKFMRNKYSKLSNGDIKVFVYCSGADSPRPCRLRKNNRGLWKVVEFSSLVVGMRKPPSKDDDDL
ncbi:MAG: hypothetical protein P1V97_38715 [Planctomycetota bacterium]|nr:hypothetical protein [Planctomycetota bacterium]